MVGCWRQLISVGRVGAGCREMCPAWVGEPSKYFGISGNSHAELDFYMGSMYERSRFSGSRATRVPFVDYPPADRFLSRAGELACV